MPFVEYTNVFPYYFLACGTTECVFIPEVFGGRILGYFILFGTFISISDIGGFVYINFIANAPIRA